MSFTDLGLLNPGPPDNTYQAMLHTGGVAINSGATIYTGDGVRTPLWMSANSIGIRNAAGLLHVIQSQAAFNRTLTLFDADGTCFPETLLTLAADATNSTVTPASVADLAFTPPGINTTYLVEGWLLVRSAATGTGVRIDLTGPSQVTPFVGDIKGPTTSYGTELVAAGAVLPIQYQPGDSPAANTTFIIRARGQFKVGATNAASPILVQLYSETVGSQVTMLAGSWMRYRRIL